MKCGSGGAAKQFSQLPLVQVKATTSGAVLAWASPAADPTSNSVLAAGGLGDARPAGSTEGSSDVVWPGNLSCRAH